MKKLLNIICVLILVVATFFTVIPVSEAKVGVNGETITSGVANEFFNETENVGENFCSEPSVKQVTKFFGFFILLLKFIVPILIIVKGMFLFYNAMVKGGTDDLAKNAKELLLKIFLGLLVFYIPSLIRGILDLYNDFASVRSEYTECADCLLDPVSSCK